MGNGERSGMIRVKNGIARREVASSQRQHASTVGFLMTAMNFKRFDLFETTTYCPVTKGGRL
jgi:hypothetical protein